ncbi:hypothetical protein [Streptomyces chrestomyceticus]|uniref:hypothetical protein n=1 Tax=Streptomyces chrestomyceticus TaxID=68185 RepID=UPI0033F6147D
MSAAELSMPSARTAVFPPPAEPLLFTDGDRFEWPVTGDVWVRTAGDWMPAPDDGSGYLSDAQVRASLRRAIDAWNPNCLFLPALPGDRLPGRPILTMPTGRDAAQYVLDHQDNRLVPVRDLVATHDEDAAYDIPGVVTAGETARVLSGITTEYDHVRVRYDEAAGRIYVRYSRYDAEGWRNAAVSSLVTCLHVFVLAASTVEA